MAQRQSIDPAQERSATRRNPEAVEATPQRDGGVHPLIGLQHQIGNAQIARMLAQREGPDDDQIQAKHIQREGAEEGEVQAKHVQREGAEEDEVQAKHVQRQGPDDDQIQAKHIQREGADEDEVQAQHVQRQSSDDDKIQAKHVQREPGTPEVGPEGGEVSGELSGRINAMRGNGSPLDGPTRSAMENGFGTSFSGVRVHTSGDADTLNRSLSAKAFTTGSDIFFSRGSYQPESSEGKMLLSHELAHVVQQRSMTSSGPMRVSPAGDANEQHADSVAQQVVSQHASAQRKAEDEG